MSCWIYHKLDAMVVVHLSVMSLCVSIVSILANPLTESMMHLRLKQKGKCGQNNFLSPKLNP